MTKPFHVTIDPKRHVYHVMLQAENTIVGKCEWKCIDDARYTRDWLNEHWEDGDRQFCQEETDLLLPPNVTKLALKAIVEQLRFCGFTCEGGPLELNTAFLALVELAEWGPPST